MAVTKLFVLALLACLFCSQVYAAGSLLDASEGSSQAPVPDLESSEASDNAESSDQGPAANVNGLAGMGIAVVLRNRNHIRTIEDKSADHVEREESRKQLGEEQKRKEHYRRITAAADKARRDREMADANHREGRADDARKLAEEQSQKKVTREESDKTQRQQENQQKAKASDERKREQDEKREDQRQKEEAKKAETVQEQNNKKEEDTKNGVLRKPVFKPVQGSVLRDAAAIGFTGEFTYMFWLRPLERQGPWANIFHKGVTDGTRNPAVWFYPGQTRLHVRSGTSRDSNAGCDPETHPGTGEWTHVAITHNSWGIRVYFGGNQVCESPIGAPLRNDGPLYTSNPWYVSARCDLSDFRFTANIQPLAAIQKAAQNAPQ